jgi:tRNA pseudouridine55 synthase
MSAHGLLVLDKPPGITSRDAVDRAAKWFPRKTKIGHAGTLDPMATGVLVLAIGQATRLIEYVQAMPKVYRARIRLGATSDTDDADGVVTPNPAATKVTLEAFRTALDEFVGEIEQVPPAYSAARVEGRRAYDLARRGHEVVLAPRPVRIDQIDLLAYAWPDLDLDISCGKGTYIRSIARDLGRALGVGGYLTSLRRLQIGPFLPDAAVPLDADAETARSRMLPLAAAVSWLPSVRVTAEEARRLRNGLSVPATGEGEVAAYDAARALIAVGRVDAGALRPDKVMM